MALARLSKAFVRRLVTLRPVIHPRVLSFLQPPSSSLQTPTSNQKVLYSTMPLPTPDLSTQLVHVDDPAHATYGQGRGQLAGTPVGPSIVTSTTFRAPHPDTDLSQRVRKMDIDWAGNEVDVYSRWDSETRHRAELVLSALHGEQAMSLLYASGLAAAAAAITHFSPSVVAIRKGYPGVHGALNKYARGRKFSVIDLDDPYPTVPEAEQEPIPGSDQRRGGLLVWVECPLNPTGEARDIQHYADKAHQAGGFLVVDSTFAPPPLQNPFNQSADLVMHSGTKYLGGHSDLLAGVLVTKSKAVWGALFDDRIAQGAVPGNLESFLLLRSLRTLPLRVNRQSQTATVLAAWLHSLTVNGASQLNTQDAEAGLGNGKVVNWVWHPSLQPWTEAKTPFGRKLESPGFDPRNQMSGGFTPCFSINLADIKVANAMGHATQYFVPATSLGGVESLLEQRVHVNPSEDPGVVRISVGLEDVEDLKADLRNAFLTSLAV